MATNRNRRRRELSEAFKAITLPDKDTVPSKENLPPIYEGILDTLHIRTRLDLSLLRDIVTEKLMEKQEEERNKLLRCIMNGTIKAGEQIPLMRNENSDGSVDMQIPESMMPLVMFVAWLNEKVEE